MEGYLKFIQNFNFFMLEKTFIKCHNLGLFMKTKLDKTFSMMQ